MRHRSQRFEQMRDHLVILVHGINTRALWMYEIKPALERAGFSVAATSYGKFGVPRFLLPFRRLRNKAINDVVRDIRTAIELHNKRYGTTPKKMSVISHSFGTYLISRILVDCPEFSWDRIIFCGSVVRDDFSFPKDLLYRFNDPLLNEVGTRDYLPALAESVGWGYGSVGSTGFNRPPVETRWHHGFGHSDFLTERFCNSFWVPFLRGAKPIPADKPANMPLWIRGIIMLPLRWILPIVVTIVALSAAAALGIVPTHVEKRLAACIGEGPLWADGSGCPPNLDHYFDCDFAYRNATDADKASGEQICKTERGAADFSVLRLNSYSGHRCGYIVDQVICRWNIWSATHDLAERVVSYLR
jgi:pimeloyl-ACP methyl ester carboxylesterase